VSLERGKTPKAMANKLELSTFRVRSGEDARGEKGEPWILYQEEKDSSQRNSEAWGSFRILGSRAVKFC